MADQTVDPPRPVAITVSMYAETPATVDVTDQQRGTDRFAVVRVGDEHVGYLIIGQLDVVRELIGKAAEQLAHPAEEDR